MNSAGEPRVRAAIPADLEAILQLDRAIDHLPHWPAAEYLAALAGTIAEPGRCVFVAESEGQLVGLAVGVVHEIAGERLAELETVGVALTMQRQGIGRELCRSVIAWCQSRAAAYVDLEVRSRSAGAIALYRELGFVAAGVRRGYYRDPADDAVLMRLDLKRQRPEPAAVIEPAT